MEFRRVIIDKLGIDVVTHDPVVILTDEESGQVLPLVIGIFEATSIAFALEHHELPRPLSHDIIKDLIEQLDAKLLRVEIHSIDHDTYFSNLILENKSGEIIEIDARPSDAIAVALRMEADVYIAEELLLKANAQSNMTAVEGSDENGNQRVAIRPMTPETGNKAAIKQEKEDEVNDFLDNFDFSNIDLDDED